MSSYGTISVGAAAAVVVAANNRRESVYIQNTHATQDLYLGYDSSVTDANGFKLAAGQSIEIKSHQGPVYGYGSGAATTGRYLEQA